MRRGSCGPMSGKIRPIGAGSSEAEAPGQAGGRPPATADQPPEATGDAARLAQDIMNMMEQGILYWSPEGVCQ